VVRGHPRSLKIVPFDRAHMSSYLAPFLRYSEILVKKHRCEPTPSLFGAPIGDDRWAFADIFCISKLESLCYRMAWLMWS